MDHIFSSEGTFFAIFYVDDQELFCIKAYYLGEWIESEKFKSITNLTLTPDDTILYNAKLNDLDYLMEFNPRLKKSEKIKEMDKNFILPLFFTSSGELIVSESVNNKTKFSKIIDWRRFNLNITVLSVCECSLDIQSIYCLSKDSIVVIGNNRLVSIDISLGTVKFSKKLDQILPLFCMKTNDEQILVKVLKENRDRYFILYNPITGEAKNISPYFDTIHDASIQANGCFAVMGVLTGTNTEVLFLWSNFLKEGKVFPLSFKKEFSSKSFIGFKYSGCSLASNQAYWSGICFHLNRSLCFQDNHFHLNIYPYPGMRLASGVIRKGNDLLVEEEKLRFPSEEEILNQLEMLNIDREKYQVIDVKGLFRSVFRSGKLIVERPSGIDQEGCWFVFLDKGQQRLCYSEGHLWYGGNTKGVLVGSKGRRPLVSRVNCTDGVTCFEDMYLKRDGKEGLCYCVSEDGLTVGGQLGGRGCVWRAGVLHLLEGWSLVEGISGDSKVIAGLSDEGGVCVAEWKEGNYVSYIRQIEGFGLNLLEDGGKIRVEFSDKSFSLDLSDERMGSSIVSISELRAPVLYVSPDGCKVAFLLDRAGEKVVFGWLKDEGKWKKALLPKFSRVISLGGFDELEDSLIVNFVDKERNNLYFSVPLISEKN